MIQYLWRVIPEILLGGHGERIPEPMLMLNDDQVDEYLDYATRDSTMLASYIYHAAGATSTFRGCETVVDLGCGPATQLAIIAESNPQIHFVGVDLSATMLNRAEALIKKRGIRNIELVEGDISELKQWGSPRFDGILSTVAVHHLPSSEHLENMFKAMRRVLKKDGKIYLTDFTLLRYRQTMELLVNLNKNQPPFFREDYLNSLKAAFPLEEIQRLASQYFPEVGLYKTFMLPFMFILKSKGSPLNKSDDQLEKLYGGLSKYNRKLFKDIYRFFELGGVENEQARMLLKKGA